LLVVVFVSEDGCDIFQQDASNFCLHFAGYFVWFILCARNLSRISPDYAVWRSSWLLELLDKSRDIRQAFFIIQHVVLAELKPSCLQTELKLLFHSLYTSTALRIVIILYTVLRESTWRAYIGGDKKEALVTVWWIPPPLR
jgi:hypothetical protein